MITVVRSKDGKIKTFSDGANNDYNQSLGETIERIDCSMEEYASRFKLSCNGVSGETLQVRQGSGDLLVQLNTKESSPIELSINGLLETVQPANGVAAISLSTEVPGLYIIEPADRSKYCAAGEGLLVIEVLP